MSDGLVEQVTAQLGGNAAGVLGSVLGEPAGKVETALSAAVPALLTALIEQAETGGEPAERLAAGLVAPPTEVDRLPEILRSGRPQPLIDAGTTQLRQILGQPASNRLVSAIGRFAGIGGGSARALLGLLTPVALAALARAQGAAEQPPDARLAALTAQRALIQDALPPGLDEAATAVRTGPAIAVTAPLSRPAAPVPPAASTARPARPAPAAAPTPARPRRRWFVWLLVILLILAALAWLTQRYQLWPMLGLPPVPGLDWTNSATPDTAPGPSSAPASPGAAPGQ